MTRTKVTTTNKKKDKAAEIPKAIVDEPVDSGRCSSSEEETEQDEAGVATKHRFGLLDSLLEMKNSCASFPADNLEHLERRYSSYRYKNRSLLKRSFEKGITLMMGISLDTNELKNINAKTARIFSSLMACELEQEVYDKFPNKKNPSQMSLEYREKLKSLRHNLEDIKNPTLCSRVLLRKISIGNLVRMPPEELASKRLQENRVKAIEEANKNIAVLDPMGELTSFVDFRKEMKNGDGGKTTVVREAPEPEKNHFSTSAAFSSGNQNNVNDRISTETADSKHVTMTIPTKLPSKAFKTGAMVGKIKAAAGVEKIIDAMGSSLEASKKYSVKKKNDGLNKNSGAEEIIKAMGSSLQSDEERLNLSFSTFSQNDRTDAPTETSAMDEITPPKKVYGVSDILRRKTASICKNVFQSFPEFELARTNHTSPAYDGISSPVRILSPSHSSASLSHTPSCSGNSLENYRNYRNNSTEFATKKICLPGLDSIAKFTLPPVNEGRKIASKNGGDKFTFKNPSMESNSFTARLCTDPFFIFSLEKFLPSTFSVKGRLDVKQFNKFAFDKMKSGWKIFPLRLSLAGCLMEDCQQYKQFYQYFEKKGRIAMFEVSKQTKLFLVTPKFVKRAECLWNGVFRTDSSYAIVLTKENLSFDSLLPSQPFLTSPPPVPVLSKEKLSFDSLLPSQPFPTSPPPVPEVKILKSRNMPVSVSTRQFNGARGRLESNDDMSEVSLGSVYAKPKYRENMQNSAWGTKAPNNCWSTPGKPSLESEISNGGWGATPKSTNGIQNLTNQRNAGNVAKKNGWGQRDQHQNVNTYPLQAYGNRSLEEPSPTPDSNRTSPKEWGPTPKTNKKRTDSTNQRLKTNERPNDEWGLIPKTRDDVTNTSGWTSNNATRLSTPQESSIPHETNRHTSQPQSTTANTGEWGSSLTTSGKGWGSVSKPSGWG